MDALGGKGNYIQCYAVIQPDCIPDKFLIGTNGITPLTPTVMVTSCDFVSKLQLCLTWADFAFRWWIAMSVPDLRAPAMLRMWWALCQSSIVQWTRWGFWSRVVVSILTTRTAFLRCITAMFTYTSPHIWAVRLKCVAGTRRTTRGPYVLASGAFARLGSGASSHRGPYDTVSDTSVLGVLALSATLGACSMYCSTHSLGSQNHSCCTTMPWCICPSPSIQSPKPTHHTNPLSANLQDLHSIPCSHIFNTSTSDSDLSKAAEEVAKEVG